jgi:hypothetical protein
MKLLWGCCLIVQGKKKLDGSYLHLKKSELGIKFVGNEV